MWVKVGCFEDGLGFPNNFSNVKIHEFDEPNLKLVIKSYNYCYNMRIIILFVKDFGIYYT